MNPDKIWGACFLHHLNGHRLKSWNHISLGVRLFNSSLQIKLSLIALSLLGTFFLISGYPTRYWTNFTCTSSVWHFCHSGVDVSLAEQPYRQGARRDGCIHKLGLIWHIADLLCLGVLIMHKVMCMYWMEIVYSPLTNWIHLTT